jgi:undecaprenyl-phosphate 4-deoxy-4-formamido-L-arabinose transferase
VELSFVIPVYNGSATIASVVRRIHEAYSDLDFEVVLVNDGSLDDSEKTCVELVNSYPETVVFLHLARNFGEHNAVLAGLNHSRGEYLAVLDDDGQNPPEDVRRMYDAIKARNCDVIFGRYRLKHHSWFRNVGSKFNDRVANVLLKKPPDLYLSSFKVMNRFLANQIIQYKGSFPYIDGLILRVTRNVGQVDVEHRDRKDAGSNYTLTKLFFLWLNMFLNFSIVPLRFAAVLGFATSVTALLLMAGVVFDKLYINPGVTIGLPTIMLLIVFFAGVQLVILGTIGEYLGRMFLDYSRNPQFVIRYMVKKGSKP